MFYEPLKKGHATIAIVDGYSIGRFFAPRLNALGYRCIHVQSSPQIPPIYSSTFNPHDYIHNMIFDGSNLESLMEELKKHNVNLIIVGTESGVNLADLLSEKMGKITNGYRKSKARRDKFEMLQVLKEHQISTPKYIKSSDLEEVVQWASHLSLRPVVIKQLKSVGTDKVFFCYSEKEIVHALHKIIGSRDALGNMNSEVLAESFLDGAQYLINMVSVKGHHILSDLWKMATKVLSGASVVHDYLQLLPSSFHLKKSLVTYTRRVLDALEIRYGASHNEVFWTQSGPVLVEMAARIMGCVHPNLISQCIGRGQLELMLASYLQPERFSAESDMQDYSLKKHLLVKFLISHQSGLVKKIKFLDKIRALPSFISIQLNTAVGETVSKTIDLFTNAGLVYLCHEDEKVVKQDYEAISSMESELFQV